MPSSNCSLIPISLMMTIDNIIEQALQEDIGQGDHTTLATITPGTIRKARLIIKEKGILAGIDIARKVFYKTDPSIQFKVFLHDGVAVTNGDVAFEVAGNAAGILSAERVALNFLQRLSGIATYTRQVVTQLKGLKTKVTDTRKTTPLWRELEKYAVRVGGGYNHRFGLYDMILIKNNHIDYAGGIAAALHAVSQYLAEHTLKLPLEIEVRDFKELNEVLTIGGVDRIMLDNFSPEALKKAVRMIAGRYETEASGGITMSNVRAVAEAGVDFISMGALTHHIQSLDMSLKAVT
jgi:nicotinate-nucleotide pyrophosphorylase (carboxylating)